MCIFSREDNMASRSEELLHALRKTYDRNRIHSNGDIWQPQQVQREVKKYVDEVRIQWEDGKYIVCDINTIAYVLQHSIVDDLKYTADYFDCDNFASLFKSLTAIRYHLNSIGRVINYQGRHAFNVALTKNGLYVIEPQNDTNYWRYDHQEVEERYQIKKQILEI